MLLSSKSKSIEIASKRQRLFVRYLIAILLNLIVIGFMDQHWQYLSVDSFSTTISVAIALQILLKSAMDVGQKILVFLKRTGGPRIKLLQICCTWLIFFSSKIIILGILHFIFGNKIIFDGPSQGMFAFISMISVIFLATQAIAWMYFRLG